MKMGKTKELNRRGSHVGIVVSFAIFMLFLVMLYIVLQPAFGADTRDNFRAYLKNEIISQISDSLTAASVSFSGSDSCVRVNEFFTGIDIGSRLIVQDINENSLNFRISSDGNDLYVEKNSGDKLIRVLASDAFDEAQTGSFDSCQSVSEGSGYHRWLSKTTENIFESKVINLINDYNSDYDSTKEVLGLSQTDNFGFGFEYDNGTIVETLFSGEIQANVFVDNYPVQYTDKEGAKKPGTLIVRVW